MKPYAIAMIVAFVALVASDIANTSPTFDEVYHLVGGWTDLATGERRMNLEHPPLLNELAALPLLAMPVWPRDRTAEGAMTLPRLGAEWRAMPRDATAQLVFGHDVVYAIRDSAYRRLHAAPSTLTTAAPLTGADFLNDSQRMYRNARVVILLFGVLTAIFIASWSSELWGAAGGLVSLLLFVFDPNFIAHSAVVTTDVGVTALMTGAIYFFWRWSRRGGWTNAAAFALFFAAAQAAKFSALILIPVVLLCAIVMRGRPPAQRAGVVALAFAASFVLVWAAYGFRYSAKATGERLDLDEVTQLWTTRQAADAHLAAAEPPLLARTLLFASRTHLAPEAYTFGLAFQQAGAIGRASRLHGETSTRGFRSYFFWAFLIKTPVAILLAIAAGLWFARCEWRALVPAMVFIAIYGAAAVMSEINLGVRHILPLYPFLYVACGSLAVLLARLPKRARIAVVAIAVALIAAPATMSWGSHMAYANPLGGDPAEFGSDWGQDLPSLSRWLTEHRVTEPITLAYFGTADPRAYGIRFIDAEPGNLRAARIVAISAMLYSEPLWRDAIARSGLRRVGTAGKTILMFER